MKTILILRFFIVPAMFISSCMNPSPKPPPVLAVESPKSVSTTTDPNDPHLYIILLGGGKFRVINSGDTSPFMNKAGIDTFIKKHLPELTPENLLIMGNPDSRYPEFKELKDVLKKYEIFRFRIVTNGEAPPAGSQLDLPEPKEED